MKARLNLHRGCFQNPSDLGVVGPPGPELRDNMDKPRKFVFSFALSPPS